MKVTALIIGIIVTLVMFTGVVSAELGELHYDYTTLVESQTTSSVPGGTITPLTEVTFEVIESYPALSSMIISNLKYNYYYPSDFTYGECGFDLKYGQQTVGTGTYHVSRPIVDGVPVQPTLTLIFDYWDIGDLTGLKLLHLYLDNEDLREYSQANTIGKSKFITTNDNDYIVLSGVVSGGYRYYHLMSVYTYQNIAFSQKIQYDYDADARIMDIDIERNGFKSNITFVETETGTVLFMDSSNYDTSAIYTECYEIEITVIYDFGPQWTNVIPKNYTPYKPTEPTNDFIVFSELPEFIFNMSEYRERVEDIPIIGNLSVPYLDFVDSILSDLSVFVTGVINGFMSPVDIINEKVFYVSSTLEDSIKTIGDSLDVVLSPVTSIINAIPGSVMSFFIFVLLLDIVKIILTWGM